MNFKINFLIISQKKIYLEKKIKIINLLIIINLVFKKINFKIVLKKLKLQKDIKHLKFLKLNINQKNKIT